MRGVRGSLLWPIAGITVGVTIVVGLAASIILVTFFPASIIGIGSGGMGPLVALSGLIGLLGGGIATMIVHGMVIRRLQALNAALFQAAHDDTRLTELHRAGSEVAILAEGIDALIATLRTNYEELKQSDDLRRSMVANVSHELRTPLTSIQGYLETARLEGPDSPDFEKNLGICLRESKRLVRLVQDLFELSKLDTGQLDFHFESVSVVEIADQIGLAFEQRMEDKEIRFETTFPDDALEVWGDGNRIGQVVQNLLGNASVFTPKEGKVELICKRQDDEVLIEVSDTGVGIPERDIPRIFDSFFHLEKSGTRNLGGTGLGLSICQAIVKEHRGRIWVESTVGEGTTFSVALPQSERSERDD